MLALDTASATEDVNMGIQRLFGEPSKNAEAMLGTLSSLLAEKFMKFGPTDPESDAGTGVFWDPQL